MERNIKLWLAWFCYVLVLAGVLAPLGAVTRIWNNEEGNELWSEPRNWLGDVLPTNSDTAKFDETNSSNCIINSNVGWKAIITTNDYVGTIYFNTTVDTSYGNMIIAANTRFNSGTSKIRSVCRR